MQVYEFRLRFSEYVKLLSIVSNLAIDPWVGAPGRGEDIDGLLTYEVVRIGGYSMLKPVILLYPRERVHIRLNVLEYMLTHMLGIGSGDVGRLALRRIEEEVVPQQALVPHLDARLRRIVVARDVFEHATKISIRKWFTLISAIAGLHRWGFAWRRIIASTLAGYKTLLMEQVNPDLDLTASSFAEFLVNRAILYEIGEERYLHPEIYAALRDLMDLARECINRIGIELAFEELRRSIYEELMKDIECIEEIISGKTDKQCNAKLLGVYIQALKSLNAALRRMRAEPRDSCRVIAMFATETWSPIYLMYLLHNFRLDARLRKSLVLLLHTPDVTPQVLFSLMTLEDVATGYPSMRVYAEELVQNVVDALRLYGCVVHAPQVYVIKEGNDVVTGVLPVPVLPYNPQLALAHAKAAVVLSAAAITRFVHNCRRLRVYMPVFLAGIPLNAIAFSKLSGKRIKLPYTQLEVDVVLVDQHL